MNMMEGDLACASSKACLRFASDSPPFLAMISGPLMTTTCAPVSSTRALASRVLPHPGGPCRSTPLGVGTPAVVHSSGKRRGSSTSSRMSCRVLPHPPTASYPIPTSTRGVGPPMATSVVPSTIPAMGASDSSAGAEGGWGCEGGASEAKGLRLRLRRKRPLRQTAPVAAPSDCPPKARRRKQTHAG